MYHMLFSIPYGGWGGCPCQYGPTQAFASQYDPPPPHHHPHHHPHYTHFFHNQPLMFAVPFNAPVRWQTY
ncbi:hypothetical protein [Bacillus sp. FJAT-29814]|uniref:hypothetical protein n=1 Tax=Bacillus sp. FJAT-29814 TaxID=1729688 RepID=UPI000A7963D8|nr:hypothetical protein [Bacillus sp. FJAT-29814]